MVRRIGNVRGIAEERIKELFLEAASNFRKFPQRSHRYVQMALRISAKPGVRIPKEFRRNYCRKCKHYLLSGVNSKVRTNKGKVVVSCMNCGNIRRILIKPKI